MALSKQNTEVGMQKAAILEDSVDVYLRSYKMRIPDKNVSSAVHAETYEPPIIPSNVLTSSDIHDLRRKYSSEKPPSGMLTVPQDESSRSERLRKRTYTKVGGSLVNAQGGYVPVIEDGGGAWTASLHDSGSLSDGAVTGRSTAIDKALPSRLLVQQDYSESEGEEQHELHGARFAEKRASRAAVMQHAQQLLLARRGDHSQVLQVRRDLVRPWQGSSRSWSGSRAVSTASTARVPASLKSHQTSSAKRLHPRMRKRVLQAYHLRKRQSATASATDDDQDNGDSLTDTEEESLPAMEVRRAPPRRPGFQAPPPPQPVPGQDWQDMEETLDKQEKQRGKLVTFFKNGDPFYRGLVLNINKRTYPNFETLLVDLTDKIPMVPAGVFRYVFRLPDRRLIKSVTEFERGRSYVVSKDKKFKNLEYGTGTDGWKQAVKVKRNDLELFKADASAASPGSGGKTRVLTITSNTNRSSMTKLLVNPTSSKQTFDDLLLDLASMVDIRYPPPTALFTREPPQQKIASFSQLIREGKSTDDFLVCGTEQLPLEQLSRLPSNTVMSGGPRYGPPYPAPQPPRKTQSVQSLPSKLGQGGASPPQPRRPKMAAARNSPFPSERSHNGGPHGNSKLFYVPHYHRNWRDVVRKDILGRTREFYAPSQPDAYDDGETPDKRLRLDWVYGFRGRDIKQNLLVYPDTGELIYFVAAVVVLYDKNYECQRHYLGHTEEITCMCMHPNMEWVASGQRSGETGAHVRVWNAGSLNTHHVIGLDAFQVGIAAVSFSIESGGELLVAVDESKKHEMTVWDVEREKLLARTTTTMDQVNACSFYPADDSILITAGKQHLFFWKIFWNNGRDSEGKVLRDKKSGVFQDEVPKHITAMCFSSAGEVITGDTSGAILVWSRDNRDVFTLAREQGQPMRKSFRRPVTSLCFPKSGLLLAASGTTLRAFDAQSNFRQVKERVIPDGAGTIRTICPQDERKHDGLYIGTMGGCVLQGFLQRTFNYLIQGHSDAVWALAAHPNEPSFITAGHDQFVTKWNAVGHAVIWRVMVEAPCTCLAINPRSRGGVMAAGTVSGIIILLNSYNGMHLSSVQVSVAQLNCMAFSPDGEVLAAGGHDGMLHTLEVQDDYRLFQKDAEQAKGNLTPICQLDWSSDGRFLQTVHGDYELNFWEAERLQQVKNARTMRDTDWYTNTATVGYNLTGPWENMSKGDVMNVVARSNYRDMVVTGDSRGHLRLYKYPSTTVKPKFQGIAMYSDNITAAAFLEYDGLVVTAGGGDANLVQWAVINPTNQR